MAEAKQEINNGASQSRVVLAKPRLGGFGSSSFAASTSSKSSSQFGSVLRPPQLKPSSNPFLKVADTDEAENVKKSENQKDGNVDTETPKFVPLGSTNTAPRTSNPVPAPGQPATSSAGFVFGQNLSERVVMKEKINNGDVQTEDHTATNGTTEMLFTSAAASVKDNNQEEQSTSENSGDGLAAAAAEYERSHARPPPPAAYCTMTGEEEETNILQISCRLFAWESGSWRERGRGVLRLNESTDGGARLVARVAGSLRVILNTKLWPEMVLERAGLKSLRITATDAQQQVKLYLIMGAPADIAQLHRALLARVAGSKRTNTGETKQHSSQKAAERLDADTNEDNEETLQGDCNDVNIEETLHVNASDIDDKDKTTIKDRRLENDLKQQSDIEESSVDNEVNEDNESNEHKDSKSLKRKEPAEGEMSPKRQCPEISIQ